MSGAIQETGPSPVIEDLEQLVEWFRSACRPEAEWRVGLEHEKFGLLRESGRAMPYSGPRGLARAFEVFGERFGWRPVVDGGQVIALTREDASLNLEPGGQLELSGSPRATIHDICAELGRHLQEAKEVGDALGVDWIGLGVHPTCAADEIEWVPKPRYEIMRRYLPQRGRRAADMMKRTCSIQASFDFSDEADCAEKLRLATALAPVVGAIFANSPISAGQHRGYLWERGSYWQETDPDRCGLFREVLEEDWGFRRHVERVLDTPMLFIRREGVFLDLTGRSFRELMSRGIDGQRATLADFELHLSTLFPEARLKNLIEVRGADAGGPEMLCAVPALWKGVLYDAAARRQAWALVRLWSLEELTALWSEATRVALEARIRGTRLLEIAQELLQFARDGLRRQRKVSRFGEDEAHYLAPLDHYLFEEGRCPAARLLELWQGPWAGEVRRLIEHSRY
jgi:glutamate--cysteine ligase